MIKGDRFDTSLGDSSSESMKPFCSNMCRTSFTSRERNLKIRPSGFNFLTVSVVGSRGDERFMSPGSLNFIRS